jgi:hypothetical protein
MTDTLTRILDLEEELAKLRKQAEQEERFGEKPVDGSVVIYKVKFGKTERANTYTYAAVVHNDGVTTTDTHKTTHWSWDSFITHVTGNGTVLDWRVIPPTPSDGRPEWLTKELVQRLAAASKGTRSRYFTVLRSGPDQGADVANAARYGFGGDYARLADAKAIAFEFRSNRLGAYDSETDTFHPL